MNLLLLLLSLAPPAPAAAAPQEAGGVWHPRVEIAWNRYYPYEGLLDIEARLAEAWPEFVELRDIGESWEGRPLRLLVLTDRRTGPAEDKPAMWVDGNVHGNEVQGGEAALYLAWWLLEHQDNPRAKALLETRTFYVLPSQNPDGRDHWFDTAATAHSSRSGVRPYDDDRDGLLDEDPPNDLDGDGEITMMRKQVPLGEGTHRLDPDDPRILLPADADHPGDWILLGSEGVDDDGDGRINEDDVGGYDMNRNWPADWQPRYLQYGAGDYPFSFPETAAIGKFLIEHPNVAAVQSFHNAGGMILRGPGAEYVKYPRSDVRVYDRLGKEGEAILPFYRYMVIHADLYTVHGGFVTWTYEGLGIFSFTNELWAPQQYYGKDREGSGGWFARNTKDQLQFVDDLLLGEAYSDWKPYHHPLYGDVEIGGFKRQHGRVAPSFMIEEMCHRNAMFCIRHAEEIADVSFSRVETEDLGDGLWRVTAVLRNDRTMPSRSAMAAEHEIGAPDVVRFVGDGVTVLTGGVLRDAFRPERLELPVRRPERILLRSGVPGHGVVRLSWIVEGAAGAPFRLEYEADKADDTAFEGVLGGTDDAQGD